MSFHPDARYTTGPVTFTVPVRVTLDRAAYYAEFGHLHGVDTDPEDYAHRWITELLGERPEHLHGVLDVTVEDPAPSRGQREAGLRGDIFTECVRLLDDADPVAVIIGTAWQEEEPRGWWLSEDNTTVLYPNGERRRFYEVTPPPPDDRPRLEELCAELYGNVPPATALVVDLATGHVDTDYPSSAFARYAPTPGGTP